MKTTLILIAVSFLLASCSTAFNAWDYSSQTVNACKTTPVLMTNLIVPSTQQQYLLPNGQWCALSEVGND